MWFLVDALVILPVGIILLRLAGKKTIAEMTSFEIITTLSIGTLIGHAVNEQGITKTVIVMVSIVTLLIIAQWIQFRSKWFENVLIGSATIVIQNGIILHENLQKLRMTPGQLEMRIRQHGIKALSSIKTATIEVNGQLGFELIPEAEPVTRGELIKIINRLADREFTLEEQPLNHGEGNLFAKIKNNP